MKIKSITDVITNSSSEVFLLDYEYTSDCGDAVVIHGYDSLVNLDWQWRDFMGEFFRYSDLPEDIIKLIPLEKNYWGCDTVNFGWGSDDWNTWLEIAKPYIEAMDLEGWTIVEVDDHTEESREETEYLRSENYRHSESWH